MLPSVLQNNATDENQSVRVESVIQEAENHSWVKKLFGKTRFVLAKKGTALAPNGVLLWKFKWNGYADGTDRSASLNRFSGGVNVIDNARLFLNGKLVSETRQVGQKIALENTFMPYDAQVEVLDQKLYGNHQYFYNADGSLQLAPDKNSNEVGYRGVIDSDSQNVECMVRLDQLFPVLKDTMLPSFLQGEIIVEIDWNGNWSEIMTEVNDAGDAFTDDLRDFEVIRPRLHLNYITMADEVANALRQQIFSAEGMTIPYRQAVLVQANLNAIGNDDTANTQDIDLGFANRSVMKMYIQKISSATNSLLQRTRSDGLLQEEIQVVVNNRNLYDREVNKVSELYSYLGQTADKSAYLISGSYNQVGQLTPANLNIFNDNVVVPHESGATTTTIAGVQNNLQGRLRYLGVNFAKVRGGNDTPQNSILVGQSPLVLRINRNSASGGTNENAENNSAGSKGAYNLNIWVECVKALVMRNGVVDTIEL